MGRQLPPQGLSTTQPACHLGSRPSVFTIDPPEPHGGDGASICDNGVEVSAWLSKTAALSEDARETARPDRGMTRRLCGHPWRWELLVSRTASSLGNQGVEGKSS